jgi:rubrerythrin
MAVTLKNLESALAGESMAHIKYRYFAKIAMEEGFEDIKKIRTDIKDFFERFKKKKEQMRSRMLLIS